MSPEMDRAEITRLMSESRRETLELFDLVTSESDLRRSPGEGFRPILWHMGHVGAFEEYWILQKIKGDPPISDRYNDIFDPIKTPRQDSRNLPPIPEIKAYLETVRHRAFEFLQEASANRHPLMRNGYVFDMIIEHDYQHQETLCYLLQMLDPELKRRPQTKNESDTEYQSPLHSSSSNDMVRIEGGEFELGSRGYPFAYDNEQPPQLIELADFRLDRFPVTNGAFLEFVEAGGYKNQSLWSEEGWKWKQEKQIECPLYWSKDESNVNNTEWRAREMFEESGLKADHPVTGVSWHEAQSYARYAGKRLPTEAEWEKAASWDPRSRTKRRFSWGDEMEADRANFGNLFWGTTPVTAFAEGRSAYGCFDMTGNVWEWTASRFAGYPGFEAYPYPEYSELWFDGDHRVLKGGSWTTRLPILRCSFRNFFRPRFRIAFAGFRCAAD